MNKQHLQRFARAAVALVLGIATIFGMATGLNISASAAGAESGQMIAIKALDDSKPYIDIETNIVLDPAGKPTGYVELVFKVKTPLVQYADAALTTPWHVGDPELPVASRQNTFRNLSAVVQYNTTQLVPVSWDHEIEYEDDGKTIKNAYPDFFAERYSYKFTAPFTAADVMNEFVKPKYSTAVVMNNDAQSNSMQVRVGGPDGLIGVQINSAVDITFIDETVIGVVRFLYIGTRPITDLIKADSTQISGYAPNTDYVTSGHDRKNAPTSAGDQKDFFWFPEDELAADTWIRQVLFYTSGTYPGDTEGAGTLSGVNQFYATKTIYNGAEVSPLPLIAQPLTSPGGTIPVGAVNWTEVFDIKDPAGASLPKIHMPVTVGRAVYAWVNDDTQNGSYTSNYLFTSTKPNEYDALSNVRFGLNAGLTYHGTGTGDDGDRCAVVFYDWNDVVIGAISVHQGDAREEIEQFVETNFIHPELRKSTWQARLKEAQDAGVATDEAAAQRMLENLATSLDRKYTYAGEHPSDYAEMSALLTTLKASNSKATYVDVEAAMAAPGYANYGKTIFPDGCTGTDAAGNEIDYSGSSYPLTNKLDYAFWRRPLITTYTYDTSDPVEAAKKTYTDTYGNATDATEWVTGIIDVNGDATTQTQRPTNAPAGDAYDPTNDDFWYIHGWAVVENTANVENVWTTFSTYGELSGTPLPGYDIAAGTPGGMVYDGEDYLNMDFIRAAGAATEDAAQPAVGGATSRINGDPDTEISFATYDASAYLQFANFAEVDSKALYVKACYEPAEQMSWAKMYTIVTEPCYKRYSEEASTQSGNAYSISFDYERICEDGVGVRRTRKPWVRASYTIDVADTLSEDLDELKPATSIKYGGDSFYVGVEAKNSDVITANFTPTAKFYSMDYGLIEEYGATNFIVGFARSITTGNPANVYNNFNYWKKGDQPSYQNGYDYAQRLGTDGYVFYGTLNQIREEATALFAANPNPDAATESNFESAYISKETLLDLNLRLDKNGTLGDGTGLSIIDRLAAIQNAQKAVFHALKTAYDRGCLDENGIIEIDWHQLQYNIINYNGTPGSGIDAPPSGILSVEDCGGRAWCRRDACGENESVTVSSLTTLLEAVDIIRSNDSPAKRKQTAKEAIKANAGAILEGKYIYRGEPTGAASRSDMTKYNFAGGTIDTNPDLLFLIEALSAMLDEYDNTAGPNPVYGNIANERAIQKWLMTYEKSKVDSSVTPSFDFDETDATAAGDKYTYWWIKWENKKQPVDFSTCANTDPAGNVRKLVEAVWEEQNENIFAWDQLLDSASNEEIINTKMRFRRSTNGDYFDAAAEGTPGKKIEHDDNRTDRTLRVFESADVENRFVANIKTYIEGLVGTDGTWDIDTAIAANGITWEKIQYAVLHAGSIDGYTTYYEVAAGAQPTNGQYWWKLPTNNTRFTSTVEFPKDSGTMRPTNATMAILRQKLYNYADAVSSGATADIERFSNDIDMWFTEETAVDLVLRRNASGAAISSNYASANAEKLRNLAVAHFAAKGADNTFSSLSWSQVQYYIINNAYAGTKVAQKDSFEKYSWGDNAWRAFETQLQAISKLDELILAINSYDPSASANALDAISEAGDLTETGLDFSIGSMDGVIIMPPANAVTDDNVISVLTGMKTAYEAKAGAGEPTWADLASSGNLDKAWYLVQYYLYNRSFDGITAEPGETLLNAVARVGKTLYWWKDKWNGITSFAGGQDSLYATVVSEVEARLSWIVRHAADPQLDLSDPVNARTLTKDLRGFNNTAVSWADIIGVARTINASARTTNEFWQELQFVLLHPDASPALNNTSGYENNMFRVAKLESDAFYWWFDGGTATATAIPTPAAPTPDPSDPDQDLSVNFGENYDSNIVPNAQLMLRNLLLAMASGNTPAANTVTEDALVDIITALHIRNEQATTTATLRKDLTKYTAANKAALKTSLENLVKQVYEDTARANPATGFAGWDYVTNWDHTTHTDSGTNVFTYNKKAYDAVCALTPEQIQHWLSTGSYDSAAAEAADYWWIQNVSKAAAGGPPPEELARFIHTLVYWGNKSNANNVKAALQKSKEDYGWVAFYDSDVSTAVSRLTAANIKNKILAKAKTDSYKFNWAMFEAYIRKNTAYKAADAIAYAGDDVKYADIVFQFSATLISKAPPLADSDITIIYLSGASGLVIQCCLVGEENPVFDSWPEFEEADDDVTLPDVSEPLDEADALDDIEVPDAPDDLDDIEAPDAPDDLEELVDHDEIVDDFDIMDNAGDLDDPPDGPDEPDQPDQPETVDPPEELNEPHDPVEPEKPADPPDPPDEPDEQEADAEPNEPDEPETDAKPAEPETGTEPDEPDEQDEPAEAAQPPVSPVDRYDDVDDPIDEFDILSDHDFGDVD